MKYNSPESMVSPPPITAFVPQVYYSDIICITHTFYFAGHGSDINLRRYRTEDLGGTIIEEFYNIQFIFVYIFVNRPAFDEMSISPLIPRALEIEFYQKLSYNKAALFHR